MVIEITQKHVYMIGAIVVLYCLLLVAVFFWAKDMGYNDGLRYQRAEYEALEQEMRDFMHEYKMFDSRLTPDDDFSF